MRKNKVKIVIFILIILIIILITFYYRSLRSMWISYGPKKGDIAQIINDANVSSSTVQSSSSTLPLHLPPGFTISIAASGLPNARVMKFDQLSNILVSSPKQGKVWVVTPPKNVKKAQVKVLLDKLNNPHGLEFHCDNTAAVTPAMLHCSLYVAELKKVSVYNYHANTLTAEFDKKLLDLPGGGRHTTRTLLFKSDNPNQLLVSVGSTCDSCKEKDPRNAAILEVDVTNGKSSVYASGLRNSVFMANDPHESKVYATEMGRDFLGDNLPPDEVNIIEQGKNYGWPLCYGKDLHDRVFDKSAHTENPCVDVGFTPSFIDLPAHSAPLGIAFAPESWGEEYANSLLAAFHGSWNRSEPTGYKIVQLKMNKDGQFIGSSDFITGWLEGDGVLGRPVDLLVEPSSGNLYVSDDKAGLIYQITKTL